MFMPKVGVHALIINEQHQVLLVRKNYLNYDWGPPGGMMEAGESISAAMVREVKEETGFIVELVELIAVGSRMRTDDIIIAVVAKIIEKSSHSIDQNEIAAIDFFPFDNLPSPMKPEVKKVLEMYSQGVRGQLVEIN